MHSGYYLKCKQIQSLIESSLIRVITLEYTDDHVDDDDDGQGIV